MSNVPESAYTETNGMVYFARMLSKIRLLDAGTLREDFHNNMGKFADSWCCSHLGVTYEDLKARTLQGGSNEEILAWCYENGRRLTDNDLLIWNNFAAKLGWNDFVTARLELYKAEDGLSHVKEIQTMPEYFEYDEGRKPFPVSSK